MDYPPKPFGLNFAVENYLKLGANNCENLSGRYFSLVVKCFY